MSTSLERFGIGLASLLIVSGLANDVVRRLGGGFAVARPGFGAAMLSVELAKQGGDVLTVLGWAPDVATAPSDTMAKAVRELRWSNWIDFAIIAAYGPLFAVLAILLWRKERTGLAVVAFACAIVAASADVAENVRIFDALSGVLHPAPDRATLDAALTSVVTGIHAAAHVKWTALFAAMVCLLPLFAGAGGFASQLVSLAFAAGAVVGLIGLGRDDGLVGVGFTMTLPGFALVPFALARWQRMLNR